MHTAFSTRDFDYALLYCFAIELTEREKSEMHLSTHTFSHRTHIVEHAHKVKVTTTFGPIRYIRVQ